MKIIVGIIFGSVSYLSFSPSWSVSLFSAEVCTLIFCFLLFVIGFPIALFFRSRKKTEMNRQLNFLEINVCVQISLLVPALIFRYFQASYAEIGSLSQWGYGALYHEGVLTHDGLIWILKDFGSLVIGGIGISLILMYGFHKTPIK